MLLQSTSNETYSNPKLLYLHATYIWMEAHLNKSTTQKRDQARDAFVTDSACTSHVLYIYSRRF